MSHGREITGVDDSELGGSTLDAVWPASKLEQRGTRWKARFGEVVVREGRMMARGREGTPASNSRHREAKEREKWVVRIITLVRCFGSGHGRRGHSGAGD
jgi:hypothetical protein